MFKLTSRTEGKHFGDRSCKQLHVNLKILKLTTICLGLEKCPTVVPTQFKSNSKNHRIKLSQEAEDLLETVMHRLADRVRIRRIQVFCFTFFPAELYRKCFPNDRVNNLIFYSTFSSQFSLLLQTHFK